jgi:hypothetical protein
VISSKDKIIEKRVEQLLGVDQLYQWDTGYSTINLSGDSIAITTKPDERYRSSSS